MSHGTVLLMQTRNWDNQEIKSPAYWILSFCIDASVILPCCLCCILRGINRQSHSLTVRYLNSENRIAGIELACFGASTEGTMPFPVYLSVPAHRTSWCIHSSYHVPMAVYCSVQRRIFIQIFNNFLELKKFPHLLRLMTLQFRH